MYGEQLPINHHEDKDLKCPDCGSFLAVRVNSITGKPFLGCLNYPACHYTCAYDKDRRWNDYLDAIAVDPEADF